MSHTPLLDKLKAAREEILKGEVGALLHDIGKLHSKFYQKHCEGGTGEGYPHHKISNTGIISKELIDLLKNNGISINSADICLLELIEGHHPKRGENPPDLASLLIKCDHIDSGDDKGVVRRKQPINNTVIVSAFGKEKSRIDLICLDGHLKEFDKNLRKIFSLYLKGKVDVACFRDSVLKSIEEPFSNALGETRIPANDVTLYDHSFSTASLYKTQLARAVLEGKIESSEEWRVFGIFWNGTKFVSQAKKVADALKRQEIIKAIKKELKRIFEVEYPIGNAIFEDIDSIFFTFPAFNDSEELATECMRKAVEIIRKESDYDLWPIFALSQTRRSPTVIAQMMEFFNGKKGIEKESPVLCIQDKNSEFLPYTMLENPTLEIPEYNKKHDICPVCRIRSKKVDSETCKICLERRRGRIRTWVDNRDNKETIWIDEVADENNRIALVSLEFDIRGWLNGKWLHSLWIQTIQDWIDNADALKDQKKPEVAFLKKEGIIINDVTEINVAKTIELLRIIATKSEKPDQRKNIFLTFFNKRESPKDKDLSESIQDIENRSIINDEIQYKLFSYFFFKHPSPARLRRIWQETESFINEIQKRIHESIKQSKRIIIEVEPRLEDTETLSTWKIIGIEDLPLDNLPVTYLGDRKFITIVSFDGYKSERSDGLTAVKKFLEKSKNEKKPLTIKKDDSEEKRNITVTNITIEKKTYLPTITITKSPYQFQMLVPATSVSRVLEIVTSLYDDWFSKVKGKLPLKLGVLVANRKFPLYVLLDSASRMLKGKQFTKSISMEPYWDVSGQTIDQYYGYYPTAPPEDILPEKLLPIKNGRKFYLRPGYFDFDFLGGTADRGRIFYSVKNDLKPERKSIKYGWIKPRPYYFHEIKHILELRDILGALTKTQVNGIEQALITKLEEWKDVDSDNKNEVFQEFAKTVIIDAFKPEKWWKMSSEKRGFIEDAIKSGLLLDTVQLFNHILKPYL